MTNPTEPVKKLSTSARIVWPRWSDNIRHEAIESVSTSFLTQWYRLVINGVHFEIRPTKQTRGSETTPLKQTYYIFSAWNAHAIHLTAEENDNYNAILRHELDKAEIEYQLTVTIQQDNGWYEPSFIIHGWTDAEAIDWAWRFGQPAIIKVDADQLTVLATSSEVKNQSICYELVELREKLCPMKIAERDKPCVAYGGPWTTSSRKAAWSWQEHRLAMIALLGCDVCQDASTHPKFVPTHITHPELKVPSRFGGCCLR